MSKSDPSAEDSYTATGDPTLFGLGNSDAPPVPLPEVDDADLNIAQDFLNAITTADRDSHLDLDHSALDVEPEPTPTIDSAPIERTTFSEPAPFRGPDVSSPSKGDDLLYSATGEPFRDKDAAHFKARRLQAETGEAFEVVSLPSGQFAIRASDNTLPPELMVPSNSHPTFPVPSHLLYDEKDPKELTIDDFPEEHPVRKHKKGLALYKKLSQKHFKLKQSYRSQLSLLFLAMVGALIAAFPVQTINLIFPPASLSDIAQQIPLDNLAKGFMFLGLALSAFAFGKIIWVRLFYRYLLMPNYAKSEQGIVAKKSTKMLYANIQATDLHISFFGRLFNFGTIELSCAGTDGSEILIENIYCPEIVQSIIEARKLEDQTSQFRPR